MVDKFQLVKRNLFGHTSKSDLSVRNKSSRNSEDTKMPVKIEKTKKIKDNNKSMDANNGQK